MPREDPHGQFVLLVPQVDTGPNGKPFARLLARFKRRQDALQVQRHRHLDHAQVLGLTAAFRHFNLIG